jgi:hypothetical protein
MKIPDSHDVRMHLFSLLCLKWSGIIDFCRLPSEPRKLDRDYQIPGPFDRWIRVFFSGSDAQVVASCRRRFTDEPSGLTGNRRESPTATSSDGGGRRRDERGSIFFLLEQGNVISARRCPAGLPVAGSTRHSPIESSLRNLVLHHCCRRPGPFLFFSWGEPPTPSPYMRRGPIDPSLKPTCGLQNPECFKLLTLISIMFFFIYYQLVYF